MKINSKSYYVVFIALTLSAIATTWAVPSAVAQNFKPAPDYRAMTIDGKPIKLEDLKGEVVMLNVWATWCIPCRQEMPGLQALHEEFSNQDFRIVGVSIDETSSHGRISTFAREMGIEYDIWVDPDNRIAPTFRTIGVPETFLISRDGYIVYQWKGAFDPTSEQTKQIVQTALSLGPITSSGGAPAGSPITGGIIETPPVSAGVAFSAGLLSFLSPCVLPLIPSYAAFITGMSMNQMTSGSSSGQQTRSISRNTIFARGGLFVIGFSVVFTALGATISAAGFFFGDYTVWISRIGGAMLIGFGLHLMGLLRIPGVERDYLKMKFSKKPVGHAGAFLVGMGFGAGWTPCIGPILASILTLAATTSSVSQGTTLLAIYSAGLAIPFMVSTLALDKFLKGFQKFRRWLPWVNRISGILLIALGIILITGALALLSGTFGTVGVDIPIPGA
ncbi:MAG: cytochrome c biogenesis protein CcdA [Nitrososphaera sp.]